MKTTILTLSLLATSLAFAAPAAAECAVVEETGTFACVDAESASSAGVMAYQSGVGGAFASRGEYTMGGTTFRDTYASANVDAPAGPIGLSASEFCMARAGACFYEEHGVSVHSEPTGAASASLGRSADSRTLCTFANGSYECREL